MPLGALRHIGGCLGRVVSIMEKTKMPLGALRLELHGACGRLFPYHMERTKMPARALQHDFLIVGDILNWGRLENKNAREGTVTLVSCASRPTG